MYLAVTFFVVFVSYIVFWLRAGVGVSGAMYLAVTFFVVFVSYIVFWLRKRYARQHIFLHQGVPGPKPSVLLGNLSYLRDDKVLEEFLHSATKTYGRRFSFCLGKYPALFTSDLDDLKEVFVKNFDNFRNRGGLISVNNVETRAVVALRDQDWKRVRSILSPSFSGAKLKSFMSRVMKKRTTYLLEEVGKNSGTESPIDFLSLFQRLTLDVIAESAFATHINSIQNYDEARPFLNALRSVIPNTFNKTNAALQAFLPRCLKRFVISKELKEMEDENLKIQRYVHKVVKDRRSGAPLTAEEIVDNTSAFLIAGYDTTSTALAFTSLLLASHPDVQETLYKEIKDNITNMNEVTYDDVKHLNYLDQVWHESLRLYPPGGAMLGREVSNTTTLGDVKLPSGTFVMTSPLMVHYDPEYWPEPEKFKPERWAPENRDDIHPCTFLAFGEGPRHCIGKRFGEIEAKIALIKLFSAYELKPGDQKNVHPMPLGKIVPTISPATGSVLLYAIPR